MELTPLNMTGSGGERRGERREVRGESGHYRLLAEESAGRLVRKEIAAVGRMAAKGEGFEEQVRAFYEDHAGLVAQAMRIPLEVAAGYCGVNRDEVIENAAAVNDWETRRVAALADLATDRG